jgi:hypothetical protein
MRVDRVAWKVFDAEFEHAGALADYVVHELGDAIRFQSVAIVVAQVADEQSVPGFTFACRKMRRAMTLYY